MSRALRLPRAVRRALIDHARRESPLECCGLIVGRPGAAVAAVMMENVARSRTEYRIDDRAHIDLRRALRTTAPPLAIIGVYHSHPQGRAVPSPTDVRMALYSDWVHVIVGLGGRVPAVRAYRIDGARVQSVALR